MTNSERIRGIPEAATPRRYETVVLNCCMSVVMRCMRIVHVLCPQHLMASSWHLLRKGPTVMKYCCASSSMSGDTRLKAGMPTYTHGALT